MRDGKRVVLLTGGGAPGAAGFIKCLRHAPEALRIVTVDMNPKAYSRTLADAFYTVPRAEDAGFVPRLLEVCAAEGVDAVLPVVTRELPVLAAAKGRFAENGVAVGVMEPETLALANDKYSLIGAMRAAGIATPAAESCTTLEQFRAACAKLGWPDRPVCFKPRVSNGSRGFRIISNEADEYHLLFNEKPNSTYIGYDKILDVLNGREFPPLVVMEVLPGEEWSVDCLVDSGKCLYCLPRLRTRMQGGISVSGVLVRDEAVIGLSEAICKALGLHGNIGIQFKQDAAGRPQVLEINPRLQGTTVLCGAAGVNLPYYGLLLALGTEVPQNAVPQWGTSMDRYWEEVYFDAAGQPFTY